MAVTFDRQTMSMLHADQSGGFSRIFFGKKAFIGFILIFAFLASISAVHVVCVRLFVRMCSADNY